MGRCLDSVSVVIIASHFCHASFVYIPRQFRVVFVTTNAPSITKVIAVTPYSPRIEHPWTYKFLRISTNRPDKTINVFMDSRTVCRR